MAILVRVMGLFITAMGLVFLIKPEFMKGLFIFIEQGQRLYLIGVLRLILGIILVWGADACRLSAVVTIVGILALIGGILVFALGPNRVKTIIEWWINKPMATLRLISIIPIALGILLLSAA